MPPASPTRLALIATTFPLISLDELALPAEDPASFEGLCARVAADGYAGLDISCQHVLTLGKERFARALEASGLKFIAKCYSSGGGCAFNERALANAEHAHPPLGRGVDAHIAVFAAQVRELAGCARLRPHLLSVSGQSGRDYFSEADADRYFDAADALAAELGVVVQHETHRHRLLFSPWAAAAAVARRARLRLIADLSHYCVVTEAPCDDPDLEEAVAALAPRVTHTHARVGHEEGPQVPDPADARWAAHVAGHVRWWKAIFREHAARAAPLCTVTPEFLPFPYGPVGCGRAETAAHNAFIAGVVRRAWAEAVAEEGEKQ